MIVLDVTKKSTGFKIDKFVINMCVHLPINIMVISTAIGRSLNETFRSHYFFGAFIRLS